MKKKIPFCVDETAFTVTLSGEWGSLVLQRTLRGKTDELVMLERNGPWAQDDAPDRNCHLTLSAPKPGTRAHFPFPPALLDFLEGNPAFVPEKFRSAGTVFFDETPEPPGHECAGPTVRGLSFEMGRPQIVTRLRGVRHRHERVLHFEFDGAFV